MTAAGVIAELNPYHNGHGYLFRKARELCGADYVVAAISGSFVQRGEPAFFTKEMRVKAALENGADLVVELPLSVSVSSAPDFASGGVSLFHGMGCISHLAFGSECGDLDLLKKGAEAAAQLSGAVDEAKRNQSSALAESFLSAMRSGMTFPAARSSALSSFPDFSEDLRDVFEQPNNILGLEYLTALDRLSSDISPVTVRREGMGYHDTEPQSLECDDRTAIYPSASGLRKWLAKTDESMQDLISTMVDEKNANDYRNAVRAGEFLTADDFSQLLLLRLSQMDVNSLAAYPNVGKDLAIAAKSALTVSVSYTDLCQKLKTKNRNYTAVSRALSHILLELGHRRDLPPITDTDYKKLCRTSSYIRILGFRKDAAELLSEIKCRSTLPLVAKAADADKQLSGHSLYQFQETSRSHDLYYQALAVKTGKPQLPDLSRPLVIL